MSTLEFLRSESAIQLMERASKAAGVPLSLHFVERNQEGPKILSWGQCEACANVAQAELGPKFCRQSRSTASTMTIRQHRPIAFICHMGLAAYCITPFEKEHFVLTFGPYCSKEDERTLDFDLRQGLQILDDTYREENPLPFSIEDIQVTTEESIPTIATWLKESLNTLRVSATPTEAPKVEDPPANKGDAKPRTKQSTKAPALANAIATALAGNDLPKVRTLLQGSIAEITGPKQKRLSLERARILTLLGQVLETAEQAGLPTQSSWEALSTFTEKTKDNPPLEVAMAILAPIKRKSNPKNKATTTYAELNAILKDRLEEGITLNEVATLLKQAPSTITKRLQRKFGMSYSDYLGRLRVEKAKELLRRTRLTATTIGKRVGVADQSNFAKVFTKHEGMSPSEYRKRYRKKP